MDPNEWDFIHEILQLVRFRVYIEADFPSASDFVPQYQLGMVSHD